MSDKKIIALIPARAGSERIKNKNFRLFCGIPLLIIAAIHALHAGIFDAVAISSDEIEQVKKIFENFSDFNKILFHERPATIAHANSLDHEWIYDIFSNSLGWGKYDYYAILRPTNPFRTFGTIRRAWEMYKGFLENEKKLFSLKSIHEATERPEKMWHLQENDIFMHPLHSFYNLQSIPHFEMQSKNFGALYVQNGCIDICPAALIKHTPYRYIGDRVIPFLLNKEEAFDLNTEFDWNIAEIHFSDIMRQKYTVNTHAAEVQFFTISPEEKLKMH